MLFNCFGKKENPAILLMHGMLQDWHSMYEFMHDLEDEYYLVIPAMDGVYPNSPVFESFEKEADEIIDYVNKNLDGHLLAVYGVSQGGLMMSELLSRNVLKIDYAFMDGVYVAHQGKLSAWCMTKFFLYAKKNDGQLPKIFDYVMKKMGLGKEDYIMLRYVYWDADEESIRNNIYKNYTYEAKPSLKDCETKVFLWCGSKEPYALKSHAILKKYLKNYEETIWQGLGHGQKFYFHGDELCQMMKDALNRELKK